MKEMINKFKKNIEKTTKNARYEIRYNNEIARHAETKHTLKIANDRIKELEAELDRNYQNARILYLQKLIKRKNDNIENLRNENLKIMKGMK